jgi:hypothetical protein
MSTAARIGVGVGQVQKLDEDDLERDALGLSSRQAANPHHAGDRGLERLTLGDGGDGGGLSLVLGRIARRPSYGRLGGRTEGWSAAFGRHFQAVSFAWARAAMAAVTARLAVSRSTPK